MLRSFIHTINYYPKYTPSSGKLYLHANSSYSTYWEPHKDVREDVKILNILCKLTSLYVYGFYIIKEQS